MEETKKNIAKYMLYIYIQYVKDNDFEIYKSWAKPIFKSLWFIKSCFMWLFSIVFFPIFWIGMKIDDNMPKIKKIYNLKYLKYELF